MTDSVPNRQSDWLRAFEPILGRRFVGGEVEELARSVAEGARFGQLNGKHLHFLNAYSLVEAEVNKELDEVISSASSINFVDGKPISLVSKWCGGASRVQQVRGPEFFEVLLDVGRDFGVRHFFLGSTNEVLDHLSRGVAARYPGVEIVGRYSPPFGPMSEGDLEYQDSLILNASADVVWVGLGTPKQDLEAARLARNRGPVPIAVGAAFDYSAGTLSMAPSWMRAFCLEWFYRLLREPRRLWRRYLLGNIKFLLIAFRSIRRNG